MDHSHLESGGGRFDSRLAQVVFGSLVGRVGSFFHEFWDVLGCVWEWFRDVFGLVWEGFVKNVLYGSPANLWTKFSNMTRMNIRVIQNTHFGKSLQPQVFPINFTLLNIKMQKKIQKVDSKG